MGKNRENHGHGIKTMDSKQWVQNYEPKTIGVNY
jgi:hypothetical protein